jgi:hypothetical protein
MGLLRVPTNPGTRMISDEDKIGKRLRLMISEPAGKKGIR